MKRVELFYLGQTKLKRNAQMSKAEHKWAEVTEQNAKDIVEIKHSIEIQ